MRFVAVLPLVACMAFLPARASSLPTEADRVSPFGVTPPSVVTAMLRMAAVTPEDFVVDLGSGDGRLVIAAAQEFGARGLGVDIDARLVEYATAAADAAGVAARARFEHRDLFRTDVSQASVVTIYLLPSIMDRVAAKLAAELRPGARVVTHDYVLPGWRVERVRVVDAPEKKDTSGQHQATIYLFVAPPRR
jgi:ribosomal protein L11 methylase PrmA